MSSGALPRGVKSWIYSCPENAQKSQARTGYSKQCLPAVYRAEGSKDPPGGKLDVRFVKMF